MYAGRLERVGRLDGVAAGHVDWDLVVLEYVVKYNSITLTQRLATALLVATVLLTACADVLRSMRRGSGRSFG